MLSNAIKKYQVSNTADNVVLETLYSIFSHNHSCDGLLQRLQLIPDFNLEFYTKRSCDTNYA